LKRSPQRALGRRDKSARHTPRRVPAPHLSKRVLTQSVERSLKASKSTKSSFNVWLKTALQLLLFVMFISLFLLWVKNNTEQQERKELHSKFVEYTSYYLQRDCAYNGTFDKTDVYNCQGYYYFCQGDCFTVCDRGEEPYVCRLINQTSKGCI
jgi:ATP-dependent Zn protease